ncbi:UNVERIFIED_CONTAM: hypothetical protein HDU68_011953 [Siphonaria sp. JEL0065]|nr:hypothetical protein HDU68_011953 [Siphonaria sp. JEL0065]
MNAAPEDLLLTTAATEAPYDSLAGLDFASSSSSNTSANANASPLSNANQTSSQPSQNPQSSNIHALANSLKDVDIHTHNLLANLLTAAKPMASFDHPDGFEMDESHDLALLMKEMDNTYDALGELESRAEDILGKLDAFLHENGFEGDIDLESDGEAGEGNAGENSMEGEGKEEDEMDTKE